MNDECEMGNRSVFVRSTEDYDDQAGGGFSGFRIADFGLAEARTIDDSGTLINRPRFFNPQSKIRNPKSYLTTVMSRVVVL
jgi:hypothetical protein